MSARLCLEAVGFAYEATTSWRLEDLDLDLECGQLLALLGANGSGKSTLLRLMAGLLPPSTGRVRLEGTDLARWRREERARRIAFLPQRVRALYRCRAREVVELARHPHQVSGWNGGQRADQEAIDRALDEADARALADRDFDTLSGGERQRVLLAAALAQGGEVLLLDEPTAALDLPHQVDIFRLLRSRARQGRAVAVATHDWNLAAATADRVLVIEAGRPVAIGTPAEVIRPETVGKLLGPSVWIGAHPLESTPCVLPRLGDSSATDAASAPDSRPRREEGRS